MNIFLNIIIGIVALLAFLLVILVHEFGHFIAAKKCGVKVNEFAIGMGPKIFKIKKNDTLYSIRLFPIGGFCDVEGENKPSDNNHSYASKPVWQRMIIIVAGAVMNMVLAFIFMSIILVQQNQFVSTKVSKFSENSVINQYGIEIGDEIISINNYRTKTSRDISFAISISKNFLANIEVKRDNKKIILKNVNFTTELNEKREPQIIRDFYFAPINKNFYSFFVQLFRETSSIVRITYKSLFLMITGKVNLTDIVGPIGVLSVIGNVASAGLEINLISAINNIIFIMIVITVSLGITNLLPIPALDGGKFTILLFELITKKRMNPDLESKIHTIGFILLMLVMILVTFSDIFKLFK